MIPYGKQNISIKDIKAVTKVLESDFLTQGPEVVKFESNIAEYVGSKYSVAVNSATSALHLGCLALGVKKDDIVWTVPNSFVASSNAALYCGAKVDFVDIDLETNNISINNLEKKLKNAKKNNRLPKVLIPVHLAGLSCDMSAIKNLSDIYGFKTIEDASHCIGGSYKGKKIGSCEYSDLCIFSFHPVKIITTGEGGIVTSNSKTLYKKLEKLRTHGITKDKNVFVKSEVPEWYYQQHELGFNYRMTDIHAALGSSQLKRLDSFISTRLKIANFYIEELNNHFDVIKKDLNEGSSNHLFIIKTEKRDIVRTELLKNKIFTTIHYFPIHLQPYYKEIGFKSGDFPNAEKYGQQALSIPLHPGLKKQDLKFICKVLKKAIQ